MNESLRRALIRAQLREEDVAARLNVDPKTVRRWLEAACHTRATEPRWPLSSAPTRRTYGQRPAAHSLSGPGPRNS